MRVHKTGDNAYIIRREGYQVPVGLTGKYNTQEDAQTAIDWYYTQSKII